MAVRMASWVGLDSRTSSQRTSDSSTFCDLINARAFRAYTMLALLWMTRRQCTLSNSFLGCFLSNLLHATIADLLEPVSSASVDCRSSVAMKSPLHTINWTNLTVQSGCGHFGSRVYLKRNDAKISGSLTERLQFQHLPQHAHAASPAVQVRLSLTGRRWL